MCGAKSGVAIGGQAEVSTNGISNGDHSRRRSDEKTRADDSEYEKRGDDYYDNVAIGSQAKVINTPRRQESCCHVVMFSIPASSPQPPPPPLLVGLALKKKMIITHCRPLHMVQWALAFEPNHQEKMPLQLVS